MALYNLNPVHDIENCTISFQYLNGEVCISIVELPIDLRYRRETMAGSLYGVKFMVDENSPIRLVNDLIAIELELAKNVDDDDDRYNFLN